ncbi:hypothetical protein B0H14DRAFT_3438341 [Mycena olivaceomarginata]|nr:hypothetical protein B0H14DRAFT_3438341 [Mycena olivaceomarginata]
MGHQVRYLFSNCFSITYLLTTDVLYAYLHLLRRSLPSPCRQQRRACRTADCDHRPSSIPLPRGDRTQSPEPHPS